MGNVGMNLFTNGRHAQDVTEAWRNEYNELRPHSSLSYQTPAEFAAQWREQAGTREPETDTDFCVNSNQNSLTSTGA